MDITHKNIRDEWDICLEIKKNKSKGFTLKLQARIFAIVFSYMDYRYRVISLLQVLSHGTRAYVWNLDGLKGYVKKIEIMTELQLLESRGELANITKYQSVNLKKLRTQLGKNPFAHQFTYLKYHYPCLYIFFL